MRQIAIYAVAMALFNSAWIWIEGSAHHGAAGRVEKLLAGVPNAGLFVDVAFAAFTMLVLSRTEETLRTALHVRIMSDVQKRLERLRHFKESLPFFTRAAELERMLVETITATIEARYVHLFLHRDSATYASAASYPPSAQQPLTVDVDRPSDLRCAQRCCASLPPSCCIHDAVLYPPMPVAGKLFGFFVLGPKACEHGSEYSKPEAKALYALAREAGATLHELRGHA